MEVVRKKKDPTKVKIKDVMPKEVIKVVPYESYARCLDLIKENRCRHLLVFNEDYSGLTPPRPRPDKLIIWGLFGALLVMVIIFWKL